MRSVMLVSTFIVLFTVTGCGGGGSDSTTDLPVSGSPEGQELGQRELPGATVSVKNLQSVVPGTTCAFRVTFTGSEVTALTARVGSAYGEGDAIAASQVAGQPGQFDISMPIPIGMSADTRIWVSATLADGSVIESGFTDFALN